MWAEGIEPIGGGLYYERSSNEHWRLQAFETGHEAFMTGGWVPVLASAAQVSRERARMEQAALARAGHDPWQPPGVAAGGVPGRALEMGKSAGKAPSDGAGTGAPGGRVMIGSVESPRGPRSTVRPDG